MPDAFDVVNVYAVTHSDVRGYDAAFFTVFRNLFTLLDGNQREPVPAGNRLTYDDLFSDPFPAGYADLFTGGDIAENGGHMVVVVILFRLYSLPENYLRTMTDTPSGITVIPASAPLMASASSRAVSTVSAYMKFMFSTSARSSPDVTRMIR